VSDKATACPYCDYPFTHRSGPRRPIQLVERTSKRWKAIRGLGWVLVLVGVLVVGGEWVAGHGPGLAVGWSIAFAGVACLGVSKAGAWWYHG
jgi:hypothetical protein